jgi:hypothetical protein
VAKRKEASSPSAVAMGNPMLIVNRGDANPVAPQRQLGVEEVKEALSPGLGFERVKNIPGSTYRDNSTVIIVPERSPMFHHRVVQSWQGLISPMNAKRSWLFVINEEVGQAYTNTIKSILAHPELSKWKYIMTLESDNLPPADAHIRLLETIEWGNYDAVSGIYFTKGEINMPQAYGDPTVYKSTGVLDFRPRDIRAALQQGSVMEVNGIAMGCALWHIEMFKQIEPPWFVTVNDVVAGKGASCFTQDLYFCQRAVQAGKRFAVDFRVKVGHMDLNTGLVY